ncbi:winged helix-turn-helix domain-containing protein [Streptomyces sp. NPDC054796]
MTEKSAPPNGRPPHEMVAATLRERIRAGDLTEGTRLPTQKHLVSEFDVNRTVVRQALETLKREGFLTDTGRGAPPTVAVPVTQSEAPQTSGTELSERLYEAFRAKHVTIDSFSLTTETFNSALSGARLGVFDRELTPESVTVRVIVPSPTARLAIPRLIDDPDDPRVVERLHELQRTWTNALRLSLEGLRDRGHIAEVSCEIRTVAATPLHKLYLLNRTEALMGYYRVLEQQVTHQGEQLDIFDVLGIDANLYRSSSGPDCRDEQEASFVKDSQQWFNSLWDHISEPFPAH